MKILLHSHSFHPAVGGVETIAATLAGQLHDFGHEVIVVTETKSTSPEPFSFEVIRQPSMMQKWQLALCADIIHANGASLIMVPYAALTGTPFVWTHNGYQVSCIDGLGWDENGPTPMEPWLSFCFYSKRLGIAKILVQGFKLFMRRLVAKHFAYNVAATQWVALRQPLPNQQVAYTPYPLSRFIDRAAKIEPLYDFVFVGRLVHEKGVETLIRAMSIVHRSHGLEKAKLAIVGDGPLKSSLQNLVDSMGLNKYVDFTGKLLGNELSHVICSALIGIVPSGYEEPMGGIALELLASGRCIIVSKRGGMAECVGDAGLCFENGNSYDLAQKMILMAQDKNLRNQLLSRVENQLGRFQEDVLTRRYLELYQSIITVHNHT